MHRAASIRMSLRLSSASRADDVEHRLETERAAGDEGQLLRHGVVLADGATPLHSLVGPFAGDLGRPLRCADGDRHERQPPRVQRAERDPQAVTLAGDPVLLGNEHVLQDRHGVLDPAQAHERVAVHDRDPLAVVRHHEGADPTAVTVALGHLRHHHDDVRNRSVGGPELAAADPVATLDRCRGDVVVDRRQLDRRRDRGHARRIGADAGLGEQERADVILGHQRQPLLPLLLATEHPQRLGDTDRLVRAEQRANRRVPVGGDRQRLAVVHLRQPQAAVLRRDLHPECADPLQRVHHVVGDLRLAFDRERVGLRHENLPKLGEETFPLLDLLRIQLRLRMDQIETKIAQEQLLAEARQLPLRLPCRLDDIASFLL